MGMGGEILAFHATDGFSNGLTEAVNLLIKKVKRVRYGFRNFTNYRLRLVLHCGVTAVNSPDREPASAPTHFAGMEPVIPAADITVTATRGVAGNGAPSMAVGPVNLPPTQAGAMRRGPT